MLHCFCFTGFGNYSDSHNWDNGLEVNLNHNPIKYSQILKDNEELVKAGFDPLDVPTKGPKVGIHYNLYTYGGSRNVEGVVIAASKTEATAMLNEFKNSFKVVEYKS